jgi:hypothetical protein
VGYYELLVMQAHRGSDDEPPTLRPPFDPAKFARDSERALVAAESATESARPTRPPPPIPEESAVESGQLLVSLSIESDDVPFLAAGSDGVDTAALSPLARAFLRYVNQRDCIAVICSRAGLRMDDAVIAIEELAGAGVVRFQRTMR